MVEARADEYIAMILGIHESGMRLITRNYDSEFEPLRIMDYFGFEDLRSVELSGYDLLLLHTQNGTTVQLYSDKAPQIKELIDEFLYGPNAVSLIFYTKINNLSNIILFFLF